MICDKIILTSCDEYNCSRQSRCVVSNDTRQLIVCKENKKEYRLINDKGLLIINYHMDGGVIDDSNQKKCDYLIYIPSSKKVILIELKGTQFSNAVTQILETLKRYKNNFRGCHVYARIVGQGVPNIHNDANYITLTKDIRKLGGDFFAKTNIYTECESTIGSL